MDYAELVNYINLNNRLPDKDQIKHIINSFDNNGNNILIYIITETKFNIPNNWSDIIDVNITNVEDMNIPMLFITHRKCLPHTWMFNKLNWDHLEMAGHNIQMICAIFCNTVLPNFMIEHINNINQQNSRGETILMLYFKHHNTSVQKYMINLLINEFNIDYSLHDDNMKTTFDYLVNGNYL